MRTSSTGTPEEAVTREATIWDWASASALPRVPRRRGLLTLVLRSRARRRPGWRAERRGRRVRATGPHTGRRRARPQVGVPGRWVSAAAAARPGAGYGKRRPAAPR